MAECIRGRESACHLENSHSSQDYNDDEHMSKICDKFSIYHNEGSCQDVNLEKSSVISPKESVINLLCSSTKQEETMPPSDINYLQNNRKESSYLLCSNRDTASRMDPLFHLQALFSLEYNSCKHGAHSRYSLVSTQSERMLVLDINKAQSHLASVSNGEHIPCYDLIHRCDERSGATQTQQQSPRVETKDCETKSKENVAIFSTVNNLKKSLHTYKFNYTCGPASGKRWGIPTGLGLLGGGESSNGNNTVPSSNQVYWSHSANQSAPNVQNQWPRINTGNNSVSQLNQNSSASGFKQSIVGPASWAQAAGKGLPSNTNNHIDRQKQQLERLNVIREVLLASEGWGGSYVNQDAGWELPQSPPQSPTDENNQVWKKINNGTELWETTVRSGGPLRTDVHKNPWDHIPSSAFGGTWGEEDEGECSVWSNASPSISSNNQWNNNASGLWNKKDNDWSSSNNSWNENLTRINTDCNSLGWNPSSKNMQSNHWNITSSVKDNKSSGWEEPSPLSKRQSIVTSLDDGTAVWGNPTQQQAKVSHWREMPTSNPGRVLTPFSGHTQSKNTNSGLKSDNGGIWNRNTSRNTWCDVNQESSNWNESFGSIKNLPNWNDNCGWGILSNNGICSKSKTTIPSQSSFGRWVDGMDCVENSSWSASMKQMNKQMSKEVLWSSRPYNTFLEMGYKKEDAESALKSNLMIDDAISELNRIGPENKMSVNNSDIEGWREHVPNIMPYELNPHSMAQNFGIPGACSGPRFCSNLSQQSLSYNPPSQGTNIANLMNHNPYSVLSLNPLSQRMLQPQNQVPNSNFYSTTRNSQNNPSTSQLKVLVQQIQMAVQTGHLNPQILNQPWAPQTLILLNELLQQIKVLQTLNQQHLFSQHSRSNSQTLQISVQITKTKQQITNLQNQIVAQQALYMKQQQQQQFSNISGAQVPEMLRGSSDMMANVNDSLAALSINHSRLYQWIGGKDDPEFNRNTNKLMGIVPHHANTTFNPLLDTTWSNVGKTGESGWPENGSPSSDLSADAHLNNSNQNFSLADLPEFEPGKPWKGNPLKNSEDDPTITPGSVVCSPISVPLIKDNEIFSNTNKNSTVSSSGDMIALSPSSWSYPHSKQIYGTKNPLLELSNDIWASKSRCPPPGILATGKNAWCNLASSVGLRMGWGEKNTCVVLLKNITSQIDANTLRTVCKQHGLLESFQLVRNLGVALIRYGSKEEAIKAQSALHNCPLGSLHLNAELISEADVQFLLKEFNSTLGKHESWNYSQLWPSSSLWVDGDSNHPIGSVSFLPGDVLNSENV